MNYDPIRYDSPEPATEREMYSRLEPHGSLLETDADESDGFNWDDYYRYEEQGDDDGEAAP